MLRHIYNENGSALITVISVLIILSFIGIAAVSISNTDMEIAGNVKSSTKAFYAAEAGLAFAEKAVWEDYISSSMTSPSKSPGERGNITTFRAYLNSVGLSDSSKLVFCQSQAIDNVTSLDSVTIFRDDFGSSNNTELTVTSYGRQGDAMTVTTETLRAGGAPFDGFNFSLLSNNVNCIMCHARFDNAARYYNTDASKAGSFGRTKIGTLESLLIRQGKADSYIAGTLYTRGIVTDKEGNEITDLDGVEGYDIDSDDGNIEEPMSTCDLVNTSGDPLPENGNLYLNYPTEDLDMTDGPMPETFPPAIPDANGNKIVDDAEFADIISEASGSISGGTIYGVPSDGSYGGSGLPGTGNEVSISGSYDGNLVLVGTVDDPIILNSDIAVDGDVVIKGVVKGTGQIYTKNNIYIVGDVTYADGTDGFGNRTFGLAADGSENGMALTAGGNILIGDYLTPAGGDISDVGSMDFGDGTSSTDKFSFTMSEMTLFNRTEWTKTQEYLISEDGDLVYNSTYDATYVPRYYTMGPGDPVYIFANNESSKAKVYWDPSTESWKGKEHTNKYDPDALTEISAENAMASGASVINLAPSNTWLSEAQLKELWIEDEAKRMDGDPFKIDGLLYTNNSIYALSRSNKKYGSKTYGSMLLNGGMIAADMGVLTPSNGDGNVGLQLNYDERLRNYLDVYDETEVLLARVSWYSE
ncbi:MAG: hypothetical protein GY855_10870 [candidate division Zixibacteria bacterium]|nr:hypothetical protein [candidate division Zixibacteria bacterium]